MSRIDDGFPTLIAFSAGMSSAPLEMWEKEVSPPGMEGGGALETTTMRNITWRTKSPKQLISLADASLVVAYDPEIYNELLGMVNVNQSITITFPDGEVLTFWGWIDVFSPNAIVEGEQPTADITIIPSNQNATGVETAPTLG